MVLVRSARPRRRRRTAAPIHQEGLAKDKCPKQAIALKTRQRVQWRFFVTNERACTRNLFDEAMFPESGLLAGCLLLGTLQGGLNLGYYLTGGLCQRAIGDQSQRFLEFTQGTGGILFA